MVEKRLEATVLQFTSRRLGKDGLNCRHIPRLLISTAPRVVSARQASRAITGVYSPLLQLILVLFLLSFLLRHIPRSIQRASLAASQAVCPPGRLMTPTAMLIQTSSSKNAQKKLTLLRYGWLVGWLAILVTFRTQIYLIIIFSLFVLRVVSPEICTLASKHCMVTRR